MKKKKNIVLTIFCAIGIISLFCNFSLAHENSNLFDDILKMTNSKPIEYGVTAVFTTDENGEKLCNDILKKLDFSDGSNRRILKNEKNYCIEFGKNNTNGYIKTMKYEKHNVITLNMVEKNNKNGLDQMQNKIQKSVEGKNITARYFQYLKSQISDSDIDRTNNKILKILKDNGATNINTIALENGYSATAYTGRYGAISNNGKLMDFNYAVCKYHSGNYIIIGTPEIITTY